MKTHIFIIIAFLLQSTIGFSQSYNWSTYENEARNTISAELGMEYGMTATFRYSRYMEVYLPAIIQTDITMPFGSDIMDDFRYRLGAQIQIFKHNDIRLTGKVNMFVKRFENPFTIQYAFGGEYGLTAGYYRSRWFVNAEFTYDRTGISHIRHTQTYMEFYPEAKEGWYENMSGNFHMGIGSGVTLGRFDLTLQLGITRDNQFKPQTLPAYAIVGTGIHL